MFRALSLLSHQSVLVCMLGNVARTAPCKSAPWGALHPARDPGLRSLPARSPGLRRAASRGACATGAVSFRPPRVLSPLGLAPGLSPAGPFCSLGAASVPLSPEARALSGTCGRWRVGRAGGGRCGGGLCQRLGRGPQEAATALGTGKPHPEQVLGDWLEPAGGERKGLGRPGGSLCGGVSETVQMPTVSVAKARLLPHCLPSCQRRVCSGRHGRPLTSGPNRSRPGQHFCRRPPAGGAPASPPAAPAEP